MRKPASERFFARGRPLEGLNRKEPHGWGQHPEINLAKWGNAVDATSHRAGFVVCGDLEVAARMVSAEPVVVGGPQVKDKIKELVLYSISEEFSPSAPRWA